jgi:hypothetical protein
MAVGSTGASFREPIFSACPLAFIRYGPKAADIDNLGSHVGGGP